MDYADLLFSARIFADADVNWKNFLGLEYQPFKVFMIMENKERTPAEDVVYTQYIPKDVPFYWVDHSINIPILKTPGGKFVDLLRGSNVENSPDYDMDSDGHPDAWLDTASIFPKGYTLVEEEVYWANPWNHLRTGDDSFIFEDIDRDGQVAVDSDGDNDLDLNLDTNNDGDIDATDGPGPGNNGLITGVTIVPDIAISDIRAVRIWMLARTGRRDNDFLNSHTYVVGHKVITPSTDAVSDNDNLRMRLLTTIVKCRNLGL